MDLSRPDLPPCEATALGRCEMTSIDTCRSCAWRPSCFCCGLQTPTPIFIRNSAAFFCDVPNKSNQMGPIGAGRRCSQATCSQTRLGPAAPILPSRFCSFGSARIAPSSPCRFLELFSHCCRVTPLVWPSWLVGSPAALSRSGSPRRRSEAASVRTRAAGAST